MASADRHTDDDEGTRLVPTSLSCKSCRHEWEATSLLGGSLEQWVAWLETHKCPACQTNYRLEHTKHREPEEYLTDYQKPTLPRLPPQ